MATSHQAEKAGGGVFLSATAPVHGSINYDKNAQAGKMA